MLVRMSYSVGTVSIRFETSFCWCSIVITEHIIVSIPNQTMTIPTADEINWKTIHKNTVIQHALQHWARGGKSDHKKAHEIWAKAKRHRILDEDSDLLNLTRSRSRYQIKPNSEGVAALYIGDVEWEPVEVECGSDSSDDDDEEGRLATVARGVLPTVPQDTAQENHQAAADQVFGNAVAAILPAANGGGLSGLTTLSIAPVYAPQNHTHIHYGGGPPGTSSDFQSQVLRGIQDLQKGQKELRRGQSAIISLLRKCMEGDDSFLCKSKAVEG